MSHVTVVEWQSAVLALLAVCLLLAAVADARSRKIPNFLIAGMLLLALAIHFAFPVEGSGIFSNSPGSIGIGLSLAGLITGLGLFLPFYFLRAMGAGDVKLFAAVGAFAGPAATVNLALCVLLAGGLLALARLLLFPGGAVARHNLATLLGQLRPGSTGSTFDARTQTAWRMPYAVAIAGGVAFYAAWTLSGRAPFIQFW